MVELTELDGVAEGRADNLKDAGYEEVEDLTDADPETLAEEVNYLPEDTALDLVVQSQNLIAEDEAEVEETEPKSITEDVEEAVEEVEEETVEEDEPEVEEVEEETVEEDEPEVEEVDDEPEEISFELTFDEPLEYDTFFDAVMSQRATMLRTNRDGVNAFEHALDQMRASTGVGATVELEMEAGQLNDLHNCVRQMMVSYKGDNLIAHMDALKKVLNDINEVREEHLF